MLTPPSDWAQKGWTNIPRSEGDAVTHWTCTKEDDRGKTISHEYPIPGELAPRTCGEPKPSAPGLPWWIWALAAAGAAWFLLRKRRL